MPTATTTEVTHEHLEALALCVAGAQTRRDNLQDTLNKLHAQGDHRHDETYERLIEEKAETVRLGWEALSALGW